MVRSSHRALLVAAGLLILLIYQLNSASPSVKVTALGHASSSHAANAEVADHVEEAESDALHRRTAIGEANQLMTAIEEANQLMQSRIADLKDKLAEVDRRSPPPPVEAEEVVLNRTFLALSELPRLGERDCCTFEFVKARMDLVQQGVCGSQYTTLTLFSHGWGVDLMVNTGNRLAATIFQRGNPVWLVNNNWHYAKGVCEKQNLECYFKKVIEDRPPAANRTGCVPTLPKTPPNCCYNLSLPANYADQMRYFGYEYLTQPLPRWKELASKRAEALRMPEPATPCAVMHIRRSDTLLNRGWGGTGPPVYRNVSLAEYLDHAREYLEARSVEHIILMTDDVVAVEETKGFTEFQWHWLDRKRFEGSEGGWENHFPSGSRETEVVDILALTMATRQCNILVASRSSFASMHHDGMKVYQKDPWYVYVETRNGISTDRGALKYAVNHGKRNPGHGKWPIHVTAPPDTTRPA